MLTSSLVSIIMHVGKYEKAWALCATPASTSGAGGVTTQKLWKKNCNHLAKAQASTRTTQRRNQKLPCKAARYTAVVEVPVT